MNKCVAICIVSVTFYTQAFALTASERKTLEQVQVYIRQSQVEYKAAQDAVAQADKEAADSAAQALASNKYALETDQAIGVVKKQVDEMHNREVALKASNDKMKPLYDKVRGPWWAPGLGAIIYGFERLTVFALIAAAVVAVGVVLLVIFVPAVIPFLEMVGLAIMRVLGFLGSLLSTALRAIVAKLRKAPIPAPAPVIMPATSAAPLPQVGPMPAPPSPPPPVA
jgi:hypothetical protein